MISLRGLINGLEKSIINTSKITFVERYYSKTLQPHSIRNTRQRKEEEIGDLDVEKMKGEFRKEVMSEFRNSGDPGEPRLDVFDSYNSAQKDFDQYDKKLRRQKMFRKHFKSYVEKEVSILTWAEKDKIRYLHKTDPKEWTPAALSEAFPVTIEGVEKLLKSTFRARSLKDIHSHDEKVADRIQRIKSGDIPMNHELETKMKMRDQLPITLGVTGPTDEWLTKCNLPKIIGEFESLVSPRTRNQTNSKTEITNLSITGAISNLEQPDIGDSYMLLNSNEAAAKLKKLKISPYKRIRFKEFESIIKTRSEKNSKSPEINIANNILKKNMETEKIK